MFKKLNRNEETLRSLKEFLRNFISFMKYAVHLCTYVHSYTQWWNLVDEVYLFLFTQVIKINPIVIWLIIINLIHLEKVHLVNLDN